MTEHNDVLLPEKKSFPWMRLAILAVVLVVAVLLARFAFAQMENFISTWSMTSLPGVPEAAAPTPGPGVEVSEGMGEAEATQPSVAIPGAPTPEPWDGASRVTILVMGLDYNDWRNEEGPPRSDTMILLTIDPLSRTAGMLSIPRDLWVSIPGAGYNKINTAYQIGEGSRIVGGGPELAKQTVERLLGVPINYYAQIDFSAFVRMIDEIGGVKLDVPEEVLIDIYDDDKGKIKIKPGVQTLPGEYALAYARARNTEGADFDRAQRQQQVILAIRDRVLNFDLIPVLLQKARPLYEELSSGIHTNMGLEEAIQLAWFAKDIPVDQIKRGIIGTEHVAFGKSPDGLDILKPLPDKIRVLRDEVFGIESTTRAEAAVSMEPVDRMAEESARLSILNGTLTPGLAGRTEEYFDSLGANVVITGDAENKPYNYTEIYDYTGNPYTVEYYVELMAISEFRIFQRFNPESEVDVTIIIGNDWAGNNPMP